MWRTRTCDAVLRALPQSEVLQSRLPEEGLELPQEGLPGGECEEAISVHLRCLNEARAHRARAGGTHALSKPYQATPMNDDTAAMAKQPATTTALPADDLLAPPYPFR